MLMKLRLDQMRQWPAIAYETASTKAGCTVRQFFLPLERYVVDFAPDFKAEGWEQFDTDQDAAYFGVWVNSKQLVVLTYCEGDWSIEECPSQEHYRAAIERLCAFYAEGKVCTVIGSEGVVECRQDRDRFLTGKPQDDLLAAALTRTCIFSSASA